MQKEYKARNIDKNEFERIIDNVIKYYEVLENEYNFKFKFINSKTHKMNIIALSDIQSVRFDDDYKKIYLKYDNDYIILDISKYNTIGFEFCPLTSNQDTILIMDL